MDNEKDIFSEIVKDKLVNYSLPVDEDSWDKIAEQLNCSPKKKTQRVWIAAIAVAASIILLFLLFPVNKKTYQYDKANQLSDHEEAIIQDVPEKEMVQPVSPSNVGYSKIFRKFRAGERLAENRPAAEVISTEETTEENPLIPAKEEPGVTKNQQTSTVYSFDFEKETQIPAIKHKKRKSIRFSFGSGGNLLAENGANSNSFGENSNPVYSFFRSATVATTGSQTKDILANTNYPDATYHLPLSFGITVKKELNRTFAVESGIVYSFLATTFSSPAPQKSTADLQLHYIGIPLNIHTRIYADRFSRWEAYVSGGGMVEKGVLSHFSQKNSYSDNAVTTVASNEKIDGLQWSVGISPGIDYKMYKNYSIYLEPKVSYYFDNNQPVSARTQHPVIFGINAGLRYSW